MKNLFAAVIVAAAGAAFAESTPAMVSLVTPVQVPARDYDVNGLRLSLIYGECKAFEGLDIGVVNNTTADFTGLAIGGGNVSKDRFRFTSVCRNCNFSNWLCFCCSCIGKDKG